MISKRIVQAITTTWRLSLVALFAFSISAKAETFKNPLWIRTATTPSGVVAADLNGDGKPDLVYTEFLQEFSESVAIMFNQGNGTFSPGPVIAFPATYIGTVQVGDVNSDGIADLILVASGQANTEILVALGNGDGSFQPMIASVLPAKAGSNGNPESVAIADLDGNGAPDLILTDADESSITLCYGDNTGHFPSATVIVDYDGPHQIFTGDYNGDGKTDFIVHEGLASFASIYLNKGDGTFRPAVTYTGPNHINGLTVADIDGDNHADLVITTFDNNLALLHGNPDGTFTTSATTPITVGAQGIPFGVLDSRDYNHDGIPDLALESLDGVHILLGTGGFTYQPLAPAPVSLDPAQAAIADLNQDGNVDFSFPVLGGIAILYGQAEGSLHSADAYDTRYIVGNLAMSDFNGDNRPDFAVSVDALYPRILIGNQDGTFSLQPDTNSSPESTQNDYSVVTGDFNGDHRADLLLSGSFTLPGASYQLGNGDGTFQTPISIPGDNVGAISAGDLNNDGITDIALGNDYTFFPTSGLDILLGQSAGGFRKSFNIPVVPLTNQFGLVFADFNRDGKSDAAFVGNNELQIELGNGDGTFQPGFSYLHNIFTTGGTFDAIAIDLDGDGNLDLVSSPTGQAEIFYGRGDGTFEDPVFIAVPLPASLGFGCCESYVGAADFDQDGKLDLVLSSGYNLSILHGAGNREFGPQSDYLAGDSPAMPYIGDFNHDGYPDIAVANSDVNNVSTVTVLLNIPKAPAASVNLSLTSAPNPSEVSQSVTFTANISSANGIPPGNLTLSFAGTQLAVLTPDANGNATFTTAALPIGTDVVTANYAGNESYSSATASVTQQVLAGIAVQTVLTSSLNPASFGQSVTFTASITSATGTPTGNVTFSDGSTLLATVPLNAATSSATYATNALAAGSHIITANYLGGGGFASGSANLTEIINSIATVTAVSIAPSNLYALEPATITTQVTGTGGVSGGTVSFTANGASIGTATVSSTGSASLSYSFATPGAESVVAAYSGGGNFAASTSAADNATVIINSSATIFTAAPTPAPALQPTKLTAHVTSPSGTPFGATASGTVAFYDGAAVLGTAPLDSTATATLAINTFQAGPHSLTAVYTGAVAFAASTSPNYALTVNPLTTATTLVANPNPVALGAPVTFTASVSSLATPAGLVTFFDGTTQLGTSTLDAKGNAAFKTTSLAIGSHAITASYSASPDFAASVSPVLNETIVAFIGDFSISAGPAARTLYTGESASYAVALTSTEGWDQNVTLTCGVLPANTTCIFDPVTIADANGASALTIQTTAPAHVTTQGSNKLPWPEQTGLAVAAAALFILPFRRRLGASWFVVLLLAASVISGCGAGQVAGGTPPGTYTITLNATFSGYGQTLVRSTNVTLTVKSLF